MDDLTEIERLQTSFVNKLRKKQMELDEREKVLVARENAVTSREQESVRRCQERETSIQKREERLKKAEELMEERLKKAEKLMEESLARVKSKVVLDIGGKTFATSKTTLMSQKDSYFSALLQSGLFQPDESGSYFIDRSPDMFPVILKFLRDGVLNTSKMSEEQLEDLRRELDYYKIHIEGVGGRIEPTTFSDLLTFSHVQTIEKWTGHKIGELIGTYSACKRGLFDLFRNSERTLTIVRAKDETRSIFGLYISYLSPKDGIVFTIKSPENNLPTIIKNADTSKTSNSYTHGFNCVNIRPGGCILAEPDLALFSDSGQLSEFDTICEQEYDEVEVYKM